MPLSCLTQVPSALGKLSAIHADRQVGSLGQGLRFKCERARKASSMLLQAPVCAPSGLARAHGGGAPLQCRCPAGSAARPAGPHLGRTRAPVQRSPQAPSLCSTRCPALTTAPRKYRRNAVMHHVSKRSRPRNPCGNLFQVLEHYKGPDLAKPLCH